MHLKKSLGSRPCFMIIIYVATQDSMLGSAILPNKLWKGDSYFRFTLEPTNYSTDPREKELCGRKDITGKLPLGLWLFPTQGWDAKAVCIWVVAGIVAGMWIWESTGNKVKNSWRMINLKHPNRTEQPSKLRSHERYWAGDTVSHHQLCT